MQKYVDLPFGNHMQYLLDALDAEQLEGTIMQMSPLPTVVDEQACNEVLEFFRTRPRIFEPRKKWPDVPMLAYQLRGFINSMHRAEQGRALSQWEDAGWGQRVKRGKYELGHFEDDLVRACANMIRTWDMNPAAEWVTCIPSLRHPELVPSFAERLARELGLPFAMVLQNTAEKPEQKSRQNSMQQAHNLDGAFKISAALPYRGPVLLVDDMVDSRWTFTVAAWLLRSNGCGNVWPVALAQTGGGE
jgi:ATP-dependent DNA helicase RecQ